MTVFGRSDINEISVGGTGHAHVKTKDETYMKVTCPACEPALRKMGWVSDKRNIELTYDERLDAQANERDAMQIQSATIASIARESAAAQREQKTTTTKPRKQSTARGSSRA
jgi:hypothetical protein